MRAETKRKRNCSSSSGARAKSNHTACAAASASNHAATAHSCCRICLGRCLRTAPAPPAAPPPRPAAPAAAPAAPAAHPADGKVLCGVVSGSLNIGNTSVVAGCPAASTDAGIAVTTHAVLLAHSALLQLLL